MDLPALFRTQGFSAAVPQAGGRISKQRMLPHSAVCKRCLNFDATGAKQVLGEQIRKHAPEG